MVVTVPFALFTFSPLRSSLTTINELTANGSFAFKERIRVGEVYSKCTTTDFLPMKISDGRQSRVMILRDTDVYGMVGGFNTRQVTYFTWSHQGQTFRENNSKSRQFVRVKSQERVRGKARQWLSVGNDFDYFDEVLRSVPDRKRSINGFQKM